MNHIHKTIASGFILACTSTYLQAGFDFGECSGSGTFTQAIEQGQSVKVGDIPKDIEGLNITLTSDKDVDIQLFDTDNDKAIVAWSANNTLDALFYRATEETKEYLGTSMTYSGYNGTDGNVGHEFIRVDGTTPANLEMKAFGYRSGTATVDYSWTGKVGCDTGSGTGSFNQMIPNKAVTTIGEIPSGISNLEINLTAVTDIDIQLFAEDGTAIVQWPNGLISGPSKKEIDYNGMHIVYSGYNGVNGQRGHEYIKVTNATTEKLTMKAYGYQEGEAVVNYSWGDGNGTDGGGDSECITRAELEAKIAANEDVTHVNTSCITDMSYLFSGNKTFNQDISGWDVSHVTNMYRMFNGAKVFNQNIGSWNVSNVTNMGAMFMKAENFNQNIGSWDVSNVTDMSSMFSIADAFNQNISSWDVSNATDMNHMFESADAFNQNIGSWDVSNVTDMSGMFRLTDAFNQDIGSWDVGNVTDMHSMFAYIKAFNQDIGSWDVSKVTDMNKMFCGAITFNRNIGSWDVSKVINMTYMFRNAKAFNQDIGSWDVSNVIDMSHMFSIAEAFNQNIGSWAVSKVTNMQGMFYNAKAFNQDISKWNVSNVIYHVNFAAYTPLEDKNNPFMQ